MASVKRFLTGRLKLTVNRAKSAVAPPSGAEVPRVQLHRQAHAEAAHRAAGADPVQGTSARNDEPDAGSESASRLSRTCRATQWAGAATSASARRLRCCGTLDQWIRRRLRCRRLEAMEARTDTLCGTATAGAWAVDLAAQTAGSPHGPWRITNSPASASRFQRPSSTSLGLAPSPTCHRLIRRTAVYGPVRTVVWEGRSREAPPYPDWGLLPARSEQRLRVRLRSALRLSSDPERRAFACGPTTEYFFLSEAMVCCFFCPSKQTGATRHVRRQRLHSPVSERAKGSRSGKSALHTQIRRARPSKSQEHICHLLNEEAMIGSTSGVPAEPSIRRSSITRSVWISAWLPDTGAHRMRQPYSTNSRPEAPAKRASGRTRSRGEIGAQP